MQCGDGESVPQVMKPGAGFSDFAANPRLASELDEGRQSDNPRVHRPAGCEHEQVLAGSAPPFPRHEVVVEGTAGTFVQGDKAVPADSWCS